VPVPGADVTRMVPPTCATRSRMPRSPFPATPVVHRSVDTRSAGAPGPAGAGPGA